MSSHPLPSSGAHDWYTAPNPSNTWCSGTVVGDSSSEYVIRLRVATFGTTASS